MSEDEYWMARVTLKVRIELYFHDCISMEILRGMYMGRL